jgi:hypothetical protein
MTIWHKRDIKLFIVLIPIINLVNYFITYDNITLNAYFFLTLFIDTLQGYLTWLIIRYVIIKMEKKSPLLNFTIQRLFLQLFFTCLTGLIFIIITTEILNAIAKDKPVPIIFYQLDIWIYAIWILVVNGIYIGMYYYLIWKNSEQNLQNANKLKADGIGVKIGKKNTRIAMNDIKGFYVEDGLSFLIDSNFKTYIIDSSLDSLEKILQPSLFFRVNRKFILHRNSIISFKRIENNKLVIFTLNEGSLFPKEIVISRLKAPAFKNWFEQDTVSL